MVCRGRPEAGRKAGGPNVVAWGAGGSWAMMGIVAGGGRMEEAVKVESSWSDRVRGSPRAFHAQLWLVLDVCGGCVRVSYL